MFQYGRNRDDELRQSVTDVGHVALTEDRIQTRTHPFLENSDLRARCSISLRCQPCEVPRMPIRVTLPRQQAPTLNDISVIHRVQSSHWQLQLLEGLPG
jgi:hypothetical protein